MLPPITALLYGDGIFPDRALERIARDLQEAGLLVAGVIQHDEARGDTARCAMLLEDLASGRRIGISEERGRAARGCRIDLDGLAQAAMAITTSLDHPAGTQDRPALLIINKFGKFEAEGGGLREVIALALGLEVPVLIGVPKRNLDAWRVFAGELSVEIDLADERHVHWARPFTARILRETGSPAGLDAQPAPQPRG